MATKRLWHGARKGAGGLLRFSKDLGGQECMIEALKSLEGLQQQGHAISLGQAYNLLQECSTWQNIDFGRRIQSLMVRSKLDSVSLLADHLIRLFSSCGSLDEASRAFFKVEKPTAYTWCAIIDAHAKLGQGRKALDLYDRMLSTGIKSNKVIYLAALRACAATLSLDQGKAIHDEIVKKGLQCDMRVGNTLVDMYAKCGSLEAARKVFDELSERNVVSWGAMIAGYVQHGEGVVALECFEKMQQDGIKPDRVAYSSALKACGSIGAIEQGMSLHKQVIDSGLKLDTVVWNTLVDMYAKCGNMEKAREVFYKLPKPNVISWGSMIAGYAQLGAARLAMQCFEDLEWSGIEPNDVTFLGVITACSRACLVNEGREYFKSMIECHRLTPTPSLYNCVVDMMGRAGRLEEAEEFIRSSKSNICGWKALLNACRMHGNVPIGKRCFEEIVRLDSSCAAGYVLMSNIYAEGEKDKLRKHSPTFKKHGMTWIEVRNKVYEFVVGKPNNSSTDESYILLEKLSEMLKKDGYVPSPSLPLIDGDKENAWCGHSEKLAITFGLLNMPPESIIRAAKNIQMCSDCHETMRRLSKSLDREIILRCDYHIHHFKHGECSCDITMSMI